MIRIPLPGVIELYTIGCVVLVGLLWLFSLRRDKRRESNALRYRLQCIICAFTFEDRSDNPLPRCPKCGSLNERGLGRPKRLTEQEPDNL